MSIPEGRAGRTLISGRRTLISLTRLLEGWADPDPYFWEADPYFWEALRCVRQRAGPAGPLFRGRLPR